MSKNALDSTEFATWLSTARINYSMEWVVQAGAKKQLSLDTDKDGNLRVILDRTELYSGTNFAAAKTAYEAVV
ncbi:MAG: hypothetical protein KAV87_36035 [Desulfobacteraceae bacterium]|nr:hypothetical protein [Desulfobacteraceae bacterium]